MKAYVYTDASLERYAGRFVWLSINTEDATNASFLKRYPIPALPTLLVLDARRDAVTLRYMGGTTAPQLRKLLDEAEETHHIRARSAADSALANAERLASEGEHAEAAQAYEEAIAAAPRSWKKLGRTSESLIFALAMSKADERCATRALALYQRVRGTVSAANVTATGLSCAVALDKKHPKRHQLLDRLEDATRQTFDDRRIVLSDDDRSGLYIALIEARDAAGDDEGLVALKHEWSAFLEEAASRAKTPQQRAVYDSHRITAYLDLGTPEKAIPMLEQSQSDFPDDYNPPARLALAYKAMKDYDRALAASDRALALVYGPRKLNVYSVRSDIFKEKGDSEAARETIRQAIAFARTLPVEHRRDERVAALEKRLASMP